MAEVVTTLKRVRCIYHFNRLALKAGIYGDIGIVFEIAWLSQTGGKATAKGRSIDSP